MTITPVKNVKTQGVGFAPILRHYFTQCGIERIIDENVELDPRRKVLTHGQAAVAMITGILFQVMQLYLTFSTPRNKTGTIFCCVQGYGRIKTSGSTSRAFKYSR